MYCLENQNVVMLLTHWGRVTHMYTSVNKPLFVQIYFWTHAGLLSNGPLRTNFSEIRIKTPRFSFNKFHSKTSSAKRRPFCFNLMLTTHSLPCNTLIHDVTATQKMFKLWIDALILNHLPYACIHAMYQPHLYSLHLTWTYSYLLKPSRTYCFKHIHSWSQHLNKYYFSTPSQSYSLNSLIVYAQSIDFVHSIHHEFLNTIHPNLIHSIPPKVIQSQSYIFIYIHIYIYSTHCFLINSCHYDLVEPITMLFCLIYLIYTQITKFMGPTPPGSCRPQMGQMVASGTFAIRVHFMFRPSQSFIFMDLIQSIVILLAQSINPVYSTHHYQYNPSRSYLLNPAYIPDGLSEWIHNLINTIHKAWPLNLSFFVTP